jgi:hypothetical protein
MPHIVSQLIAKDKAIVRLFMASCHYKRDFKVSPKTHHSHPDRSIRCRQWCSLVPILASHVDKQ